MSDFWADLLKRMQTDKINDLCKRAYVNLHVQLEIGSVLLRFERYSLFILWLTFIKSSAKGETRTSESFASQPMHEYNQTTAFIQQNLFELN